jgi:predicted amidohydrolase
VTAVELPARWASAERQLADGDALLAAGPETDLVLLPEASLTGYVSRDGGFDLRPFAEPLAGPTALALAGVARKYRVYLAGPLVLREAETFSNALALFDREGALVACYRKRHPWMPETWATPGCEPLPEIDVDGARVTAAICFDAHFLAEESQDALARADVLLFASAWVEEVDSREALLGDLARRFGVAVVNANWGRGEPRLPGQGGSMILSREGAVLARAPREPPARIDATVEVARRAGEPPRQ